MPDSFSISLHVRSVRYILFCSPLAFLRLESTFSSLLRNVVLGKKKKYKGKSSSRLLSSFSLTSIFIKNSSFFPDKHFYQKFVHFMCISKSHDDEHSSKESELKLNFPYHVTSIARAIFPVFLSFFLLFKK